MNPKISIVIATFNAGNTLSTALDSVLKQSFNDWECVIVDGVSTDETIKIIESYINQDGRFRYISEPDKGIYDAFNKGWKLAKGEWIYYLGSDDELLPNGLKDLLCESDISPNVAIISGGIIRITKDGLMRIKISKGFKGSHQSMITRRRVIEQLNGFDERFKIIADFDLISRIKNNGYKVQNKPVLVARFKAGGASESLGNMKIVFTEKLKILKKDKTCKYPLFYTTRDLTKTILGSLYHSVRRIINV